MKFFRNEGAFHRWVLAEARKRGWKGAHLGAHTVVRGASHTFAVPLKDATGFPDLVLVHPEHGLVFAECKMPRQKGPPRELRPEQVEWIRALRGAGCRVYVWLPHEQAEILAVLDGEPAAVLFDQEASA